MSFPSRHAIMTDTAADGEGRDRKKVLRGIDSSDGRSESLGLAGESGAGKSTLAAIMVGLLKPTSGSITLTGAEDGKQPDFAQRAGILQLVWQDAAGSLDPRIKMKKAIAEPMSIMGQSAKEYEDTVAQLMEEVGLDDGLSDRYPHELSGGEIQRAVIARSLATDPDILILDEPASALDARVKRQLVDLLKRLRRERSMSLIVIAHDLSLVRELTDKILILHDGEIVERGNTEDVLTAPRQDYTRRLIDSIPTLIHSSKQSL